MLEAEIAAEERLLYGAMQSAASFSYFNEGSPTSLHKEAKAARETAERQEQIRRVNTSERLLRQEILSLPEAANQGRQISLTKSVLDPQRPSSRDKARGPGGGGKKTSSLSMRQELKELEKLSKFSYFNDEPASRSTAPAHRAPPPEQSTYSAYVKQPPPPSGGAGGVGGAYAKPQFKPERSPSPMGELPYG
ncbi:hypothetical protein T484DRAFT_1890472, partial [Baffinella frigidus]